MQTVNITFDSHDKYKALLGKGFTEEQAEGIIGIFSEITLPNAATRDDIKDVKDEIRNLETNTKESIKELEASTKTEIQKLKAEIFRFILVNNVGLAGLILAIIKLL